MTPTHILVSSDFFHSFVPSFLRLGSWNIVMFVSYEQIKRAVMRFQQFWKSLLGPVCLLVWYWSHCSTAIVVGLDLFTLRNKSAHLTRRNCSDDWFFKKKHLFKYLLILFLYLQKPSFHTRHFNVYWHTWTDAQDKMPTVHSLSSIFLRQVYAFIAFASKCSNTRMNGEAQSWI